VPLLVLLRSPASRRAGSAGAAIALAIGLGWLARDLSLGSAPDLFARSVLLVRYEDFFAVPVNAGLGRFEPVSLSRFVAALPQVFGDKMAALETNAVTFVFAFGLLLVPGLLRAARMRRAEPAVLAFGALLVLVYAVESLVFTLHSTRGSYFHSLAALFPYGVALGIVGTRDLLRSTELQRVAAVAGLTAATLISVFALAQWSAAFDPPYRARIAVVDHIPAGAFMAIDAAAWRWIADRPVIVTPSSGPDPCTLASAFGATTMVLEPVHFTPYDALYRNTIVSDWVRPSERIGDIAIFRIDPAAAGAACGLRR
jgi:hypothetical protein